MSRIALLGEGELLMGERGVMEFGSQLSVAHRNDANARDRPAAGDCKCQMRY